MTRGQIIAGGLSLGVLAFVASKYTAADAKGADGKGANGGPKGAEGEGKPDNAGGETTTSRRPDGTIPDANSGTAPEPLPGSRVPPAFSYARCAPNVQCRLYTSRNVAARENFTPLPDTNAQIRIRERFADGWVRVDVHVPGVSTPGGTSLSRDYSGFMPPGSYVLRTPF